MSRTTFVMEHERGGSEGFQKLMSALLVNAIRDYLAPTGDRKLMITWKPKRSDRAGQMEQNAALWIFGECGYITFQECCENLGYSIHLLRSRIKETKRKCINVKIPKNGDPLRFIQFHL